MGPTKWTSTRWTSGHVGGQVVCSMSLIRRTSGNLGLFRPPAYRLIQGPVHPSFGLVNCTVGRVYLSNNTSWTGIPHPRCTEYDRATTSFRAIIVPVQHAASHRMPRCRRVSLAKPCYDQRTLVCAAASHWSRLRRSMKRGVKQQRHLHRVLYYKESMTGQSGDHHSFTNNQLKQSLLLAYIYY